MRSLRRSPVPTCAEVATWRVWAPALGAAVRTAMRLPDATRSNAETPAVVSSVPTEARRRTPVGANPQ
ncbi:zinc ribbon domain-containing protein [Gordonia oryzae]|uniref:Zinc ribbon domain-containing protein n=1 Tax=Gordonia oryzae TaxID=2487349 RepID=A0A3N4H1B3_9ACTN|nr:zinc ribbon domain-containing protein [Gordonia oryzae]